MGLSASFTVLLADRLPTPAWPDFLCLLSVVLILIGSMLRHGGPQINRSLMCLGVVLIMGPTMGIFFKGLWGSPPLPLPLLIGLLFIAALLSAIWVALWCIKQKYAPLLQRMGTAALVFLLGWLLWAIV